MKLRLKNLLQHSAVNKITGKFYLYFDSDNFLRFFVLYKD